MDRARTARLLIRAWNAEPQLRRLDQDKLDLMAQAAVVALDRCNAAHPDRADIVCDDLGDHTDPEPHRSSEHGIEWSVRDGVLVGTWHDELGAVKLQSLNPKPDQAEPPGRYRTLPPLGDAPEPCPECRWVRQDGQDHTQLIAGWKRCAHCGHEWRWLDTQQETRPSSWCRAKHPEFDVYCDTHHHPLNTRHHGSSTYGTKWVEPSGPVFYTDRVPNHVTEVWTTDGKGWARLSGYRWSSASGVMTEQALLSEYGSVYSRPVQLDGEPLPEPAAEPAAVDSDGVTDPHRDVYEKLIPILDLAAAQLWRVANNYRDGKYRITAELCRSSETNAEQCGKASDMLQAFFDRKGQ